MARQAGTSTRRRSGLNWSSGCPVSPLYLINTRGLHVSALMRCKFILARKIRDKIDAISPKGTQQCISGSPLCSRSQARGLVRDRLCLPGTACIKENDATAGAGSRLNIFWAPMPCRPLTARTTVRKSNALKFSTALPEVQVLGAQRGASSGIVLAADCDGQIFSRLRGATRRWPPTCRRIQRRAILPTVPTLRRSGRSANYGNVQATARGFSSLSRKASMGKTCAGSCWTGSGAVAKIEGNSLDDQTIQAEALPTTRSLPTPA